VLLIGFRKVLKGGGLIATDGNCSLGPPLSSKVDTFLGIAGPNFGLCVSLYLLNLLQLCVSTGTNSAGVV
jgi:hypothetical protein